MMQKAFGAYRAVVADLGHAERSRAWGEVRDCVRELEGGSGLETELEFILVSGARSIQSWSA